MSGGEDLQAQSPGDHLAGVGGNRARTTVRRLGRRRGGDRERVSGGKGVTCGLTLDGEAVEPGAIGELSCDDDVAEPECRWGAMRGGDRSPGCDITCGQL